MPGEAGQGNWLDHRMDERERRTLAVPLASDHKLPTGRELSTVVANGSLPLSDRQLLWHPTASLYLSGAMQDALPMAVVSILFVGFQVELRARLPEETRVKPWQNKRALAGQITRGIPGWVATKSAKNAGTVTSVASLGAWAAFRLMAQCGPEIGEPHSPGTDQRKEMAFAEGSSHARSATSSIMGQTNGGLRLGRS